MENLTIPARIIYSNKPVLMTEQLSEFYECDRMQLIKNFNNNKDRFIEGKHYFKVEGEELKKLRIQIMDMQADMQISPMTRTLYLWTKQGAFRHAKMLNTDRAWEVYELLEENYFNLREKLNAAPSNVDSAAEMEKIRCLLKCAELTNLDRLRNQILREVILMLTGKKMV